MRPFPNNLSGSFPKLNPPAPDGSASPYAVSHSSPPVSSGGCCSIPQWLLGSCCRRNKQHVPALLVNLPVFVLLHPYLPAPWTSSQARWRIPTLNKHSWDRCTRVHFGVTAVHWGHTWAGRRPPGRRSCPMCSRTVWTQGPGLWRAGPQHPASLLCLRRWQKWH